MAGAERLNSPAPTVPQLFPAFTHCTFYDSRTDGNPLEWVPMTLQIGRFNGAGLARQLDEMTRAFMAAGNAVIRFFDDLGREVARAGIVAHREITAPRGAALDELTEGWDWQHQDYLATGKGDPLAGILRQSAEADAMVKEIDLMLADNV